jgi:acyl-CoA hydrolase
MEWLHHNPYFAAYDIGYTNNFVQLAQNDNMVAINNFAMMDLYGQDCCGCVGHRPFSGTGGQFQFTLGASMSRGGRAVLAATSREKTGQPRFVPGLPPGSTVDVQAQFVTYVATEYGIVNLLGVSGFERAKRIISVAHPDDREWLEKEAHKIGLKPNHWMFSVDRRDPSQEHLKGHRMSYMNLKVTADPIGDMTS